MKLVRARATGTSDWTPRMAPVDLVPRFQAQGYGAAEVARRRLWVEHKTGVRLDHVGACSIPTEQMRGNVENPIGSVQMPLGIAGPLLIRGEHARGTFYVPLATTEGALVRSYERGMVTLTRAGGATTRIEVDENRVCPAFIFGSVADAARFVEEIDGHLPALCVAAESTTRHGRLLRIEPRQVGREVIVTFCYHTGDAQGMNMIVKATERACEWLVQRGLAPSYHIFSGFSSEKRASAALLGAGKGKTVIAGACLPAALTRACLHATPEALVRTWHRAAIGHFLAGAVGCNAQFANGLTALFIACGQDVANVVNAHAGITNFELTDEGDIYASVTLPSLTVATVGGGTALGTSRECLSLLGCAGSGNAPRFAEIAAATALAGEISMAAAIASGEFVAAHEQYGRNRPAD
ncbi:MAG: hydroxymethylglutaryl-CoA reductase [Acidobacteria bacterium]|nr:hydroxymethylglutaryl-CoA reductase [Acidobacteriota bacterium]